MRDDPTVIALVARAGAGDQGAWNEIVERYAPLVWSICLRYQLDREKIDDVGQNVWLLLVEKIGSLREPAALPGWLVVTTQRECLRTLRVAARHDHAELPAEDQMRPDPAAALIEDEILAAERDAAIRTAFAGLPSGCQDLLSMLISDYSYAEISAKLNMKQGSIGPTRARCLDQLRRSPHVIAAVGRAAQDPGDEQIRGRRGD